MGGPLPGGPIAIAPQLVRDPRHFIFRDPDGAVVGPEAMGVEIPE